VGLVGPSSREGGGTREDLVGDIGLVPASELRRDVSTGVTLQSHLILPGRGPEPDRYRRRTNPCFDDIDAVR
jgi:hypothetical protein